MGNPLQLAEFGEMISWVEQVYYDKGCVVGGNLLRPSKFLCLNVPCIPTKDGPSTINNDGCGIQFIVGL